MLLEAKNTPTAQAEERMLRIAADRLKKAHGGVEMSEATMTLVADAVRGKVADCLKIRALKKSLKETKSMAEVSESKALTDHLMQIGNRGFFDESIKQQHELSKRNGEPFSLLMVDVDHFKKVNDTLGHTVGDQVLVKVAEILKSKIRGSDMIFRFGGEEIAILLPATNNSGAISLAEKLRTGVEEGLREYLDTLPEKTDQVSGTISIGVGTGRGDEISTNTIIQVADRNLYFAKNNGRNRVAGSVDTLEEQGVHTTQPAQAPLQHLATGR